MFRGMRWTPVAPLAASLLLGCGLDLGGGGSCGNAGCSASLDLDTGSSDTAGDTDADTESGGPLNFWPGVVCTPDADETPRFYFDLRAGKDPERDYFRLPFPADARLKDGGLDLEGFPRAPARFAPAPELAAVIDRWMAHIEQDMPGFAVDGAILFRTNTGVADVRGIHYINVTPDHPQYGKAIQGLTFNAKTGAGSRTNYLCENWLAIEPIDGVVLDPGATYAVVITDASVPVGGGKFVPDADLRAMLSQSPPQDPLQAQAWPTFAPLRTFFASPANTQGLRTDQLVAATVFTAAPHRDLMARAREAVHAGPLQVSQLHVCESAGPSPCSTAPGLTAEERGLRECGAPSKYFTEIHGRVTLPIFQEGRAPYASNGGKIQADADGPIMHSVQDVCFSLTVPKGEVPEAGWPTLVVAHGTGGSFRSAVGDGVAGHVGSAGIATLALEGAVHGERRGDTDSDGLVEGLPLDQLVFNLRNPDAARDNILQGAIDQFTAVRLARQLAEATAPEPAPAALDPENVYFMGHSQGAQAGALFLSYEPDVHAAVLSGVGANLLRSLLAKTEPKVKLGPAAYPPKDLLQLAFQERPDQPLTSAHPLLMLFNNFVNRSDADVYSPLLTSKHVLMYIGHVDAYTPLRTAGSLAIGARLEVGGKNLFPGPCDQYAAEDEQQACQYTTSGFLPETPLPASGNKSGVTRVVLMREQPPGLDGHFVAFTAAEQKRIVEYLVSARDKAVPVVGD
jgi:pimeloyl-ACP methyl ester carboxylesterase